MTHSPPGRRAARKRSAAGAGPEQWLELPGWRKPLDALLVLAVTFSVAWLGLVVVPAAVNGAETPIAEEADTDAAPAPTADETTDPGQWIAGPDFTGAPVAPTQALATEAEVVAAPSPQPRAPVTRATPRRTTPRPVPRTTTPAPTTAAAAFAAATTSATVTTDPTMSATQTSGESSTSTTTSGSSSSSSSETSTSSTTTTTTTPTSSSAPAG